MPGIGRRIGNRLLAPYVRELTERTAEVKGETERIGPRLDDLQTQLQQVLEAVHRDITTMTGQRTQTAREEVEAAIDIAVEKLRSETREETQLGFEQMRRMLRYLDDETVANRKRLYAERESDDYELAFTESEPLVTYVVPTYDRHRSLREVSLPSILAQTYGNIEVVVSGDQSPPETEAVIAELADERIRFINRTVRGPYPDDKSKRWYMIGTGPLNDGAAAARGRWIATLGDDDAVVPDHAETLVAAAQADRLEHAYGRHRIHYPSGELLEVGSFPPAKGEFVLQSSLYHAGLRFFGMSPSDHLYEDPNDWSLCRRMLDAGVRFGMVDRILVEKYESRYERHSDWSDLGVPEVD